MLPKLRWKCWMGALGGSSNGKSHLSDTFVENQATSRVLDPLTVRLNWRVR